MVDRSSDAATERRNYQLVRTDSSDPAFRTLVADLDTDLAIRDGKDHAFFAQYNKIHSIKHAVVVMNGPTPVGCGAFKPFEVDAVEIKRMYVTPVHRQKGIACFEKRV